MEFTRARSRRRAAYGSSRCRRPSEGYGRALRPHCFRPRHPAVDALLELRFRQRGARPLQQRGQQREFPRRYVDQTPVFRHRASDGVEREIAVSKHVVFAHDVPPQQCAHSGGELVEAERFCQVVVGARIEARHAIGNCVTRSDNKHAHAVAFAPQLAQQFQPALARQPEVEQHHRVGVRCGHDRRSRGLTVRNPVDGVPVLLQRLLQRLADHRIIFDEENAHGGPLRIVQFYGPKLKTCWKGPAAGPRGDRITGGYVLLAVFPSLGDRHVPRHP